MGMIDQELADFWGSRQPRSGLPSFAYTDPGFWEQECRTVLSENWVCVAFAHELPEPGDAQPVTVAGRPVLVLRNAEGEVTAFENVCRHRCLTLVEEKKNVGRLIRCPYHAWAYDLDGRLRASPCFGGKDRHDADGFDPAQHGLIPVRTQVWLDAVFVNLDGKAPPFEDYAAPLIERLGEIDPEMVEPLAVLDFGEIRTNWKFIMENFIEPYHVQFVHSSTTDQPLFDHYTIVDGRCMGSAVDLDDEAAGTDTLAVSSRYLALFPNFLIGQYFPDQLGVYLNVPLGPDRTAQKRAIYTISGQRPAAADVEALKSLWWQVHREDHEMCERLQRGRAASVAASGGVLSPCWEDSVRAFQELVASGLSGRT